MIKKYRGFIVIGLLFVVGLSIMLYPVFSNWWNQRFASKMVQDYDNTIDSNEIDFDQEIKKAETYNLNLSPRSVPDAFSSKESKRDLDYEECLNISKNDMMGYIRIPDIDVELPIYHYTNKEVFEKGVGHLCGSSLPIGGKGTHAVLSAHRGLPSAKLFTDLNLLKEGDEFYLHILNKKMAYAVDDVKVVEPRETSSLQIERDKDYVTLVTCTPYGVNSHRLLVRGHRVPYKEKSNSSSRTNVPHLWMAFLCSVIGCFLAVAAMKFYEKKKLKVRVSVFDKWNKGKK